ncbi:PstS family phosphate ABC transporter substrate-binding protein [Iningainema tapete]|uniref:Substrate-binding domain-containing protein n=1 Tax=Iningainema tapete BLCC-T55 TaxID=2748662 RepID=A0A8J6XLJ2_9CYAN|nr:substrate-binding domain-containing protein [Iningainema tapete]MBD2778554.1 substrate-binding domain-containing protein [Iningainema tapete BLCC-T55]
MDNTNPRRTLINAEITIFAIGLIIGKVLTLMVIGGVFWWYLKPRLLLFGNVSTYSSNTFSRATATFGASTQVPIGSFNYGGSTVWAPIRQLVDAQIQSDRPELQLQYVNPKNGSPSSSKGIRMLLDGQLDFAQSSRPLTDEEYATAKQRGFTLSQRQVGIDGIAVVVNPSLQVSGLTINQLQQIYLGQITNWKQVGGPNLPITPFSQRPLDADTQIFSPQQPPSSQVKYVNSTTEALRQVSKTPGGVYYASARTVVPQCSVKALPLGNTPNQLISPYRQPLVPPQKCPSQRNQVNTEAIKNGSYPITTKLYVIIKQNKGREQQVGEAYAKLLLSEQGRLAIEQAGLVGVGAGYVH